MNLGVNPVFNIFSQLSNLDTNINNDLQKQDTSKKSTNKKEQTTNTQQHSNNKNSNDFSQLEKLALFGKLQILLNTRSLAQKKRLDKHNPREGYWSNPFYSENEQQAYYEDNFKHGNVVNPFEYRYKDPWLKYIMFEKSKETKENVFDLNNKNNKQEQSNRIKATHLKQGNISNCWLIATMGSMCEALPKKIKEMITVDSENNEYKVKLAGGKKLISLSPENIKPKVVAKTGAAWAGILEAAVAKAMACDYYDKQSKDESKPADEVSLLDKGYEIMDNGNSCGLAIYYLTGNNSKISILCDESNNNAGNFNWKNKLVVFGNFHQEEAKPGAPVFDLNHDGLVSEHAYSLVNQTDNNILYLFNPWGMYEPGTRKQYLNYDENLVDPADDGLFMFTNSEFLNKKMWIIYEMLNEEASSL